MTTESDSRRVNTAGPVVDCRRILCLWLPNWPIQRLVVAQNELKRQRVVLFRQDSRRGQLVSAASPLAQRDGVRIGMPLSESKSLLSRIKGVRHHLPERPAGGFTQMVPDPFNYFLPHDPVADLLAIQKLADELDGFSPIIGLQQETDHPDCIFLDITGLAHLFGGETRLAEGVEQLCRERGYLPRLAIAGTLGMAQGIAQHIKGVRSHLPERPAGCFAQLVPDPFNMLPIAALRLAESTNNTLQQIGIRDIGQLLQLPRRDLTARFGHEINRRIDQFTGALAEPIVARHQPPEFHAEQLLDHPTSHRQTIEVIIERLIEGICRQLATAQQGALQWTIRLYGQHQLPLKLYVGLFQPTATANHVVQLANMQLDQAFQPRANQRRRTQAANRKSKTPATIKLDGQPLEVTEITVTVTSCVLLAHRQRKLFDENPRLDQQTLAHLINRLAIRLGRQNVVYPTIVSGAQPEHAFQYRPLVDPCRRGPRRTAAKTVAPTGSHAMARPLTMFEPAIAIPCQPQAVSHRAEGNDKTAEAAGRATTLAPATRFVHANQEHTIINHWGPERIETGWWRGPTVRRDYWRVETETHQQFWIYFDLRKRAWFLHGEF